ncbi:MAG TPA: hypothetical protein VG992_01090 [Candidatus Saccharimonadales bacterium]|nr:hypothetical protein [Candidatus Saccharimonadales bacterium]
MEEPLATSKNGIKVTYDPVHSHAATHFEDNPALKELVRELIKQLELTGEEVARHYDMGRVIGPCDVVEVKPEGKIIYGVRNQREEDGLVPFVQGQEGDPCSDLAIHVIPQTDGTYILSSAWIGTFDDDDEPFPLAKNANERSKDFWNKHAFVYGSQGIIPGSETDVCPW